jgi:hypothetical protein
MELVLVEDQQLGPSETNTFTHPVTEGQGDYVRFSVVPLLGAVEIVSEAVMRADNRDPLFTVEHSITVRETSGADARFNLVALHVIGS